MGWLKAIFGAIGAVFGWLRDRQLINAGKEAERGKQTQKTLEAVADAAKPATADELERMRGANDRDRH